MPFSFWLVVPDASKFLWTLNKLPLGPYFSSDSALNANFSMA
jgi:hypothetical protein